MRFLINLGLLGALIAYICGYYALNGLPEAKEIEPAIHEPPLQELVQEAPFRFDYEGSSYQIIPKAAYSIRGLLVTHNNVGGIGDIYHTSKSVDLKDACLVWGQNAVTPYLKDIQFWSEPWTCFFRTNSNEAFENFAQDQLSNNHLLAANNTVRKIIQKMKVGDQVELEGLLVDYYPHGASEMLRKTSLVRDDTGNGACEVLFVKHARIIKDWKPFYSSLSTNGKSMLLIMLIIKVISFILLPWIEFKYF